MFKKFIFLFAVLFISANLMAQTWTTQTSGLTTSLNCVSTVDANVGWVGGNAGVILLTTNGGTTWTNKANGTVGTNDVYAICGLSATTCLVSTSPAATFVFRTTDGGTTWTQVFTQTGGFIDDIKFKDATTGFMYGDPVGSRWSLWKTVNAGLTWDSTGLYLPQAGSEAGWNNAMWLQGNNIWFGTNNTRVYYSNNFGSTWNFGATTGTANTYSVCFNGTKGFAGMTAAVTSDDFGATWSAVTIPGTSTHYSFNSVGNKFWVNRSNVIYGSTNNGASFAAQYTGTTGATYQAMSVIQSGSIIRGWSVSNTGLIAMYNEVVPTPGWVEQTGTTTSLYSVSAVDDYIAWTCGASGKVLRTTNKGANWVNVSGDMPTANLLYNIFGIDANTALVIADPAAGSILYRTTNGGTNWVQVYNKTGGFGDAVWMTSATQGFYYGDAVGGKWDLAKTTNGGATWDTTGLFLATTDAGWNNAMYAVGQKIWFGTNASKIMYSSNFGASWTTQTIPVLNAYGIWFNSPSSGMSGFNGLFSTANGGATWTTLTSPLAASLAGIAGVGNEWWVAGQNAIILYSANNGATWSTAYTIPSGFTGVWYHITKSRNGSAIWGVRSTGQIARYGTPLSGVTPLVENTPVNYQLSQNYPNPFNPTTKISFALPKSGFVTLKVYDVLGKEVATLVNSNMNVGSYSFEFNASNLTSGIYFYKLESNGFTETKKMMLVK